MGLLLLIPGLLFLFNGTQWFAGEDSIGVVLVAIGAVLVAIQILWTIYVASKVNKVHREVRQGFDINDFRH